jgi:hypothetical protein
MQMTERDIENTLAKWAEAGRLESKPRRAVPLLLQDLNSKDVRGVGQGGRRTGEGGFDGGRGRRCRRCFSASV